MEENTQCGPNKRFTTCGTACPRTCDDVRHPDPYKACTMQCMVGCECEQGYVLSGEQCVPESQCSVGETIDQLSQVKIAYSI
ncbi:trypsin Inhibitor like cysteine rich domain protein [Trichuris suis]|nr:trypsin Inhibitor like cysteine rich domain protein [Trichuris suis]